MAGPGEVARTHIAKKMMTGNKNRPIARAKMKCSPRFIWLIKDLRVCETRLPEDLGWPDRGIPVVDQQKECTEVSETNMIRLAGYVQAHRTRM